MRKTTVICLMLFMLLASSTSNSFTLLKAGFWDANYLIKTTVTYSNNGTEDWDLTEEDRAIGLFMNNTWQTVHLTEYSSPIEKRETDEDGNPIAILQLPKKLEPGESVNYTVTYNVESKKRSIPYLDEQEAGNLTDSHLQELREEYCTSGDTWLINDPTLNETAHTIAGNETNVLLIIERFIAWIWDEIDYGSYEGPRYPNETLSDRKGDCDDQAILLITFCRIYGIPAYLQVGCIYEYGSMPPPQNSWNGTVTSVLKHIAWHGWAVVYVPPWEWLPVDLTYIWGGKENPLNAIRTGAVTSQETIQYLNISERNYVASSRKFRDFLIENQIYIYQEDEMTLIAPKFWEGYAEILIRWFLIAIVIIAGASIAVLAYIWRVERQRLKVHSQSVRQCKHWGFPRWFG